MTNQPSFSEMLQAFSRQGSGALDLCKVWQKTNGQPLFAFFEGADFEYNLLPLVAAHFAGFSSVQMAEIVISAELGLESFLMDVGYMIGNELVFDNESTDLIDFLRKALDAFFIANNCWPRQSKLPDGWVTMLRNALDRSGRLALAITLMGRKEVSFASFQREQVALLEAAEVSQGDESAFRTAFSTSRMLEAWPEEGICHRGHLADLLEGSGALDTLTIRNVTGQSAFWSNVIYGLSENELFEPLLDHVFSMHPELALPIVRSFDMAVAIKYDGTSGMRDLDTLANSLDCLVRRLEAADLGGVLQPRDIMLNLARAGACLHEADDPDENDFLKIAAGFRKAGEPEKIFNHIFSGRVDIREDISVLAESAQLTTGLVKAHLDTPVDQVPMTYFMQWGFMARYGLVRVDVESALITELLSHMASAALSLKLKGHETMPVLRESYEALDQCMRDLVSSLGQSVETQSLLQQREEVRQMLALWGIDPRLLGVSTGKAMDRWMAGDLGL